MSLPPNKKLRVAVICGGISSEREVSLKSGKQVLSHLDTSLYETHLVEIAADGQWLLAAEKNEPLQIDVAQPADQQFLSASSQGLSLAPQSRPFDVAFIALHGAYGEDGRVQALLDLLKIPYTGSGVLASSLCMNKGLTLKLVEGFGVAVPHSFTLYRRSSRSTQEVDARILRELQYPCIIKPNASGSSMGISPVRSSEMLAEALEKAFHEDEVILVQEYIKGRELTCGVLGNASVGGETTVLPPVEIVLNGEFFDYDAKYVSTETKEICPALLEESQMTEVKRLAEQIHIGIGCDGLTRTDFILRDETYYFLETNTIPGLTEQSLCPKEAAAAGMTFGEFLGKQIELAREKFDRTA